MIILIPRYQIISSSVAVARKFYGPFLVRPGVSHAKRKFSIPPNKKKLIFLIQKVEIHHQGWPQAVLNLSTRPLKLLNILIRTLISFHRQVSVYGLKETQTFYCRRLISVEQERWRRSGSHRSTRQLLDIKL